MDKSTRICIVGGGPAGLSAGMYLEKKGYTNYTILERRQVLVSALQRTPL